MEKYFLLTAGDNYYPYHGDGNWIGTFGSWDEAHDEVVKEEDCRYRIKGEKYDWFVIIDLRDWINGKED